MDLDRIPFWRGDHVAIRQLVESLLAPPLAGPEVLAAEAGLGTLISFSTQPGNIALDGKGRNSPYSGPLSKAILIPGKDLSSILITVRNEVLAATDDKQVPWEHSALRAPFYFQPEAPTPTNPQSAKEVAKLQERLARLEAELLKGQESETAKPSGQQLAVVAPPKPIASQDACDGLLISVAQSSVRPCIKPGSGTESALAAPSIARDDHGLLCWD